MKRLIWTLTLPVLLAAAWAGRAAPQIREYVHQQEWISRIADGGSASYRGVTWRPGPARVLAAAPEGSDAVLPPDRKAVLVEMQVDAAEPVYQLTGCRMAIQDAAGTVWPALSEAPAELIRAFLPDREAAGSCDGAAYSAAEGQPVAIDTVFLIAADAPAPYMLRLSTDDGRPRFVTIPMASAP